MATRIHADDIEGHALGTLDTSGIFKKDSYRNMPQVVSSATDSVAGPHSGTKMLRCNSDGTAVWNTPPAFETAVLNISDYTDELFLRFWFRPDQNHNRTGSSGKKIGRFYYNDGAVRNDWFFALLSSATKHEGRAGGVQFSPAGIWSPLALSDSTQWHKVEYYLDYNGGGANSLIKMWFDGTLVRSQTGMNFGGYPWSPFFLTSNFSDAHDATNQIYLDDYEVFSDSTAGAAVTGSMSDATIQVDTGGGDITAPILSAPQVGSLTSDGFTGGQVDTDEGNGTLYWAVSDGAFSVSDAQLKAGTGGDILSGKAGSASVTGTGTQSIPTSVTGLSSSTNYRLHYLHADSSANDSSQATVDFTTSSGADTTAPILSSGNAGTAVEHGGFTGMSVDTDEGNGEIHYAWTSSAGSATAAQIIAGVGGDIVDYYPRSFVDGTVAVSGTGTQALPTVDGLYPGTQRRMHVVHQDSSGNNSGVVTITATTLSQPVIGETLLSSGTATLDGCTGAAISTDTGNGTLYWVVTDNQATIPSNAEIKAGSGTDIVAAGNQSVVSSGDQTIADITGLAQGTAHALWFLHRDTTPIDCWENGSIDFTTAAATARGSRIRRPMRGPF